MSSKSNSAVVWIDIQDSQSGSVAKTLLIGNSMLEISLLQFVVQKLTQEFHSTSTIGSEAT